MKKIFLFFISFFLCFSIFSQENRFVQKLEWESVPNAFEYKVEIELLELFDNFSETVSENSSVQKINYITTTQNFVELSYKPGLYRFRVYTYDFLGRESNVSEWQNFEIIKALEPKLQVLEPVQVDLKSNSQIQIPVDTQSITTEAQVVLIEQESQNEIEGRIIEDSQNPGKMIAVFPSIKQGEYKIKVTNPGGLSTQTDVVDLNFYKDPYKFINLEFQIGIGNFISYGDNVFSKWNNKSLVNLSYSFNIKYLPFDFGNNNLGFSINSTYFNTKYKKNMLQIELPTESIELNLVYQFNFLDSLLGISLFIGASCNFTWLHIVIDEDFIQDFCLNYLGMQAGVTFIYVPKKHLTIELGVKGSMFFNQSNMSFNLTPLINLGVKF